MIFRTIIYNKNKTKSYSNEINFSLSFRKINGLGFLSSFSRDINESKLSSSKMRSKDG